MLGPGRPRADADVVGSWEPYQALAKPFVLTRAARVLAPPDGVTLDLRRDVLSARPAWRPRVDGGRDAPGAAHSGRSRFDATALRRGRAPGAGTENRRCRDPVRTRHHADCRRRRLHSFRRWPPRFTIWTALRPSLGRVVRIDVVGHTDGDGDAASNLPLSRARAERVLQALDIGHHASRRDHIPPASAATIRFVPESRRPTSSRTGASRCASPSGAIRPPRSAGR